MQYEIFTIPVFGGEEQTEQMNRFLRGHKIVQVDKEFVKLGDSACWSFCVNYLITTIPPQTNSEKREKTDYKNVLNEEDFKMFSRMRMFRKQIADNDAVPAYAVFTDAELALFAQAGGTLNEKTMLEIEGIGKKRMEKYGMTLLKMLESDKNIQG